MYPWATIKAGCSVFILDCERIESTGLNSDIEEVFDGLQKPVLRRLVIRYCPMLQVSASVSQFPGIIFFKVYNSSIESWPREAAFTNTNHPTSMSAYFVDVPMTEIPVGMRDPDFPVLLTDVELSLTNL